MKIERIEKDKREEQDIKIGDLVMIHGHMVKIGKTVTYPANSTREKDKKLTAECICCVDDKFSISCTLDVFRKLMGPLQPLQLFQPFNLVVETLDDAKLLWNMANCPNNQALAKYNEVHASHVRKDVQHYSEVRPNDITKLWRLINTQLDETER